MTANATVIVHDCVREVPTEFASILVLLGWPFNIVMFKILVQRLRLRLPRHKILLSLTMSNSMQISFIAFLQILGIILQLKTNSPVCQAIRKMAEIVFVVTIITDSGSILALSVERYIACIHCFRVHEIVTDKRVIISLFGIWAAGLVCALADGKLYAENTTTVMLPLTKTFDIIYAVVVLLTSSALFYVQTRLYKLSHRMIKIRPGRGFGRGAEANDLRIHQLKVSFVASAVIALYILCMCPLAFYVIFTGFEDNNEGSKIRLASLFLAQLNTFLDPLVYGLGMADTRMDIMRELRKFKKSLCCKFKS